MKLLLDQGTPHTTARLLRELGFDAFHTSEVGMSRATDEELLQYAREQALTIITLDADFHAYLALSRATKPSVIRLRIEGLRAEELVQILERVIAKCKSELERGAVASVQPERIRLRHLPLS